MSTTYHRRSACSAVTLTVFIGLTAVSETRCLCHLGAPDAAAITLSLTDSGVLSYCVASAESISVMRCFAQAADNVYRCLYRQMQASRRRYFHYRGRRFLEEQGLPVKPEMPCWQKRLRNMGTKAQPPFSAPRPDRCAPKRIHRARSGHMRQ